MTSEPHLASPLPWRLTEPGEKKGSREIVDANGATVARITALDVPNAELIVKGVNSLIVIKPIELGDGTVLNPIRSCPKSGTACTCAAGECLALPGQ